MTASYVPHALACPATCRMPAMLDRSPTTTALAAGRAARASSALAALRACSVTECPSSASSLAAISPRPSVEPVMSTRDISNSLRSETACSLPGTRLVRRAGAPGRRASVRGRGRQDHAEPARLVSILSLASLAARWWSGQDGSAVDGHDRPGGERLGEAVQVGARDVVDLPDPAGRDGCGGVAVQLITAGRGHRGPQRGADYAGSDGVDADGCQFDGQRAGQ